MRRLGIALLCVGLLGVGYLGARSASGQMPVEGVRFAGSYLLHDLPGLFTLTADGCSISNGFDVPRLPPLRIPTYRQPPTSDNDRYGVPIDFTGHLHGAWRQDGHLDLSSLVIGQTLDGDGTHLTTYKVDTQWTFNSSRFQEGIVQLQVSIYEPNQNPLDGSEEPLVTFDTTSMFSRIAP